MTDIISARCFGCGNVIKVPAALGGKKARCPQCTNTISIPMGANDTQYNDIISDADLPEVARDGEIPVAEEGDAPFPGVGKEPGTEEPPELKRRGGTSVRGRASASGGSLPRVTASLPSPQRGTQQRKGGAKPAAKSNTGMIVGIALGVLALVILAVVVSNNSSKEKQGVKQTPKEPREKEREKDTRTPHQPQYPPEEQALVNRLMDYTGAVNRGDVVHMMKFFAYDPEEERKYRIRATELVEKKTTYDNVKVTSVGNGSITFSYGAGSTKTIAWKKDGDVWMIAELPSP